MPLRVGSTRYDAFDHGTEFTFKALEEWAYQRGVKLGFTHPGKPTENGHIESFNGRPRDECLNRLTSILHIELGSQLGIPRKTSAPIAR